MELAFMVIAVVGLLALSASAQSSKVEGASQPTYAAPPSTPQPWSPSVAQPWQPPMTPSTGANVSGAVFTGAAQVGTQVAQQSIKSSGALSGAGLTAASAGIAAGVGIIVGIVTSLLAAHSARLKGATNENQAVDQYVPVFDSFLKQLVDAYNSGQATAAEVASGAQQFDRYIYNAFRGLVGAPGTAWSDSIGMNGQCNKSCTVGCCIYYGDLGPPLNNLSKVLGFPTGKFGEPVRPNGQVMIAGRTITVPKVYPSNYSKYSRELYTITLK